MPDFAETLFFSRSARYLQKEFGRVNHAAVKCTLNMSTLVAKGNWNIAKGKLKQTLARLSRGNLQCMEGKVDELVGRIQKRKGQSRKRFERAFDGADEPSSGHQ